MLFIHSLRMGEFSSLPPTLSDIAFHHSAVGKALVDSDGRWLDVNDALCNLTGYSRAELLGLTLQQISHPDDSANEIVLAEQLSFGKAASYQLEKRYIRKDQSLVWVLLSVAIAEREGARSAPESPIFIVEAIDITRHKQAEADRNLFFKLSPDLLAIANADGYFMEVCQAWTDLLA